MQVPVKSSVTIVEPSPAIIRLDLELRPEAKLVVLIGKIKEAATRLPGQRQEEVLQIISDWELMFSAGPRVDSPVDKERIVAAKGILFLRYNNIEYIMFNYVQDLMEKIEWMKLYDEFDLIVKELLPQEIDSLNLCRSNDQKFAKIN